MGKVKKNQTFTCGECDDEYTDRSSLITHMTSHRGNPNSFHKCSTCHKKFSDIHKLARHLCIFIEGQFDCIYCGEQSKTQKQRSKHLLENHIGSTAVKCIPCQAGFKFVEQLHAHLNLSHIEKKAILACCR